MYKLLTKKVGKPKIRKQKEMYITVHRSGNIYINSLTMDFIGRRNKYVRIFIDEEAGLVKIEVCAENDLGAKHLVHPNKNIRPEDCAGRQVHTTLNRYDIFGKYKVLQPEALQNYIEFKYKEI